MGLDDSAKLWDGVDVVEGSIGLADVGVEFLGNHRCSLVAVQKDFQLAEGFHGFVEEPRDFQHLRGEFRLLFKEFQQLLGEFWLFLEEFQQLLGEFQLLLEEFQQLLGVLRLGC